MVPAGGSGRGARSARSFPGADEQRCTSIRHLLRLLSRFYLHSVQPQLLCRPGSAKALGPPWAAGVQQPAQRGFRSP